MKVSDERRTAYLAAYDDWLKKLAAVHEVLLEGKALSGENIGDQLKGLLNRESRAKQKYDETRLELLGIPAAADSPFD